MTYRIGGLVERTFSGYGFLRGDDGRQYFFLPSSLTNGLALDVLQAGDRVTYLPFAHPKGLRAREIAPESVDA